MSQSASVGIHVKKVRLAFRRQLELKATNVCAPQGDRAGIVTSSNSRRVRSAGGGTRYVDRVTVTRRKGLIQAVTRLLDSVSAR